MEVKTEETFCIIRRKTEKRKWSWSERMKTWRGRRDKKRRRNGRKG